MRLFTATTHTGVLTSIYISSTRFPCTYGHGPLNDLPIKAYGLNIHDSTFKWS
jgi:hypothetical protein